MEKTEQVENSDELVSIIVPVYNVEKYLNRCIETLVNQTYKNIEIIMVDDGSTDSSSLLCDKWANKDNRVEVIHKKNEGLAEARNSGIEKSSGEWVCFVDSDDYVSSDFVEVMHSAAIENDTLLVQCMFKRGTEECFPPEERELNIQGHTLDAFYRYCYTTPGHSIFACWVNMYNHIVFQNVRFPRISHTEDVPFVQRAIDFCSRKELVTVDRTMYYWFQREGSIMNRKASLNLLNQGLAYENVLEFWKERNKELIYEMFFETYFGCLVEEYLLLNRDLPGEISEYEDLKFKIKRNLPHASKSSNGWLTLPCVLFDLFKHVQDKKIILYGYGENGRKILPWLKYFKLIPIEIWDAKGGDDSYVDDIPYKKMYVRDDAEKIVILISVQNAEARLLIEKTLNDRGYRDVIHWMTISYAIRRKCYEQFLPFLLGGADG